jgi:hypothetical protein
VGVRTAAVVVTAIVGTGVTVLGQLTERPLAGALAHPAIGYYTRPAHDPIAELSRRVENGDARIPFEDTTGYLRPVLEALRVPVESQMLVMSKTGVQGLYTGPDNPRAIFFNDAVTVGYIRGAPLLELKGMAKIIDRSRNIKMMMEFCPTMMNAFPCDAKFVVHFLESRDFMCWEIGVDGGLIPTRWQNLLREPDVIRNVIVSRQGLG